jgi:hypothetical protein
MSQKWTVSQSVSKFWCRAPSEAHDQIFITVWQLQPCFCGATSLMRGRVWLLYMLLALANAVILRSESLETRDHILLSQTWDFPFLRLLRLAGSRWRYSTPSPHGCPLLVLAIKPRHGWHRNDSLQKFFCRCVAMVNLFDDVIAFAVPFHSTWWHLLLSYSVIEISTQTAQCVTSVPRSVQISVSDTQNSNPFTWYELDIICEVNVCKL